MGLRHCGGAYTYQIDVIVTSICWAAKFFMTDPASNSVKRRFQNLIYVNIACSPGRKAKYRAMPDSRSDSKRSILIRNVSVFDGSKFTKSQCVCIVGSLITKVGKTTSKDEDSFDEVIEGGNQFLLPGLIDSHVHLHHDGHLRDLARFGVTTALDMATWPAEKMNGLRGKVGLTDIRSAGLPATVAGSTHSHMLPLPNDAMLSGPQDAEKFVTDRIAEGSDYVKMISDIPGPTQEELDALALAARKHHKMTVAHASAFIPFSMALKAKVDCVTHVPRDKVLDSEVLETMVANQVFCVPTLVMMQEVSDRKPPLSAILRLMSRPSVLLAIMKAKRSGVGVQNYEKARQSVTAMHQSGIPILAGTDCHEEPNSFFDVKHGDSLHRELVLLVEAGLSTVEALCAATVLPAKYFDLPDRGTIAEGKRADLILLSKDPTKDIRASRSIVRVWCGGIESDAKRNM